MHALTLHLLILIRAVGPTSHLHISAARQLLERGLILDKILFCHQGTQ